MNYCACSFFATSVTFISVKPQLQRFVGSQFSNGNRSCGSSNLAEVVKLDRYLHKALAAWQGADSPFHIDWPGTITFFLGHLLQLQGGSCRVLPQFYFISWIFGYQYWSPWNNVTCARMAVGTLGGLPGISFLLWGPHLEMKAGWWYSTAFFRKGQTHQNGHPWCVRMGMSKTATRNSM